MKLTNPPKPRPISEAKFQAQILKAADDFNYLAYHTRFAIGSDRGFPDLVLVRAPRVLFIELKKQTGKTSERQDHWLAVLAQCPGVERYLWRPSDLEEAVAILMQQKAPAPLVPAEGMAPRSKQDAR